jgi:hypothetical protein
VQERRHPAIFSAVLECLVSGGILLATAEVDSSLGRVRVVESKPHPQTSSTEYSLAVLAIIGLPSGPPSVRRPLSLAPSGRPRKRKPRATENVTRKHHGALLAHTDPDGREIIAGVASPLGLDRVARPGGCRSRGKNAEPELNRRGRETHLLVAAIDAANCGCFKIRSRITNLKFCSHVRPGRKCHV